MKLRRMLLCAGIGWVAGLLLTLIMGFVVAPVIMGRPHSLQDPVDRIVLGIALLGMTPGALLGGVIGGRMSHEGGSRGQLIMSALLGLLISIPLGCIGLWLLGW
jgi:predicted MFS family arabinose efflux permease